MPPRRRFGRDLRRLVRVYWTSPDAGRGALLLAAAVALELGTVYGNVRIAGATARVVDVLHTRDTGSFLAAMGVFLGLGLAFVLVSVYRIYVRQLLEMRWRRDLTAHYVERWMGPAASHQARARGREADNPDQRVAEDVRNFVASALGLSLSLLAAIVTLWSFAGLLWRLSDWPVTIRGREAWIPGFMMWVAIAYSLFATAVAHLVGRPLIRLNFDRQRVEADFRYGLVRFRENTDAVALAGGDQAERRSARARFDRIVENWRQLITAQRNLSITTSAVGQANGLVPLLVAAPAFFAGRLSLGNLAQIPIAYTQVSASLSWFVYAYQEIAAWRASIERLASFADELDASRSDLARGGIQVVPVERDAIRLVGLTLARPDGSVLMESATAEVARGDHVAVLGPAGTGKSILLRAVAGIWAFGSGRIEVPAGARTLFLSQRVYVPIGPLRDAVAYPDAPDGAGDDQVREALEAAGLERLAGDLDRAEHWEQTLSGDEKRRLALARLLLHRPDWIFLDEATAELDETMEARFYDVLRERLPKATWITTTNRADVASRHARRWALEPGPDGRAVLRTD